MIKFAEGRLYFGIQIMKNTAFLIACILISASWSATSAQAIKQKTERNYRFITSADSILLSEKVHKYDSKNRIIEKQESFYNLQPPGSLSKEINARFDATKMIVDEHIYTHKKTEIDHERLKTKYLVYGTDEKSSKYVWRQYYDKTEEMMKEDTITYDKAGNLITRMVYDYSGSTFQNSDEYKFDKKNRLRRWRYYTYWSTVNSRSKPVTRKDKKQEYKYHYNSKGQLKKTTGERYSTKFTEIYSYDKNGKLESFFQQKYRKTKAAKPKKSEKKQEKKKFNINDEQLIRKFDKGQLILEQLTLNGKELQKMEICYHKDSLIKTYAFYQKGFKNTEYIIEYSEADLPLKKINSNYHSNGKAYNSIESTYNLKGKPVEDVKIMNGETIVRTVYEYNKEDLLTSMVIFQKSKKGLERYDVFYFSYE